MRRIIGVTLALAVASGARPARADLTDALYQDVRDVVEEVIRAEIAVSVVAKVRARSPALAFYFRGSLDRLASPYWGNLGGALRDDLVGLAGDLVFWVLREDGRLPGAAPGDLPAGVGRFFRCLAVGDDTPACRAQRTAVLDQRRSLVDARCLGAAPTAVRDRLACDLALAARTALAGRAAEARRHVIDAVADVLLRDLGDARLAQLLHDLLLEWLGDPTRVPAAAGALFLDAWPEAAWLDPVGLEERCRDPKAFAAWLGDAKAPAWVCFAVATHGLPEALRFRVALEREGGAALEEGIEFFRVESLLALLDERTDEVRPRDQVLYELFAVEAAREWCAAKRASGGAGATPAWPDCAGAPQAVLAAGVKVRVGFLDQVYVATLDAKGRWKAEQPVALSRALKAFGAALARIEDMRRMVPAPLAELLFLRDKGDVARATQALRGWLRAVRLAEELRTRWYLWPTDGADAAQLLASVDVGGLLELALDVEAQLPGSQAVAALGGAFRSGEARAVARLFGLAFRGATRELAVECLRLGLGLHGGARRPHEIFFVSLVAYMLDEPGGATVDVTRAAFRAAAKELIESAGRQGVPAPARGLEWAFWPRLSLRGSFGAEYRNEAGRAGYREVVAIEGPSLMWALEEHVGLELSVLDLAAPLAELALRPVGEFDDQGLLVLDAVRPRLGLWLAIPELTPRLALSAGVGARLVALDDDAAGGTFRYVRRTSLVLDLGVEWVF